MPFNPSYRPWPRFLLLDEGFADAVEPARFPRHALRYRNQALAERLGLGSLTPDEWTAAFARFEPLLCNLPAPLALRYHGHQFGHYNASLGDGRGFLFAQLVDPLTGRLLDLATKGSGQTPWSRGGDGRLTLRGGVREVLATSMLGALGVPTSRSLSLFETGEELFRGDEPSPTRSSVLVRVGWSHCRFGTFQRLAHLGDESGLRRLLRHTVSHYFPAIAAAATDSALATSFLRAVTERTAAMVATWMAAGFVHGVLNTDNMTVTGESFDYGPYRFLPTYDPSFVAAYFDHDGRYAFGRQPLVGVWNLRRLASTLEGVAKAEELEAATVPYESAYRVALGSSMAWRLGLEPSDPDTNGVLADAVFAFMAESSVPFERFFYDGIGGFRPGRLRESPVADVYRGSTFTALDAIAGRLQPAKGASARLEHPYFRAGKPETLLVSDVEAVWAPIAERDDFSPFERKLARIQLMADALGWRG